MDWGHLHLMAYCGYCLREKENIRRKVIVVQAKKPPSCLRDTKMMSKMKECGHTQQDTYRKVVEGPR